MKAIHLKLGERASERVGGGVGRFTVLDAEDVQPLDQGSNFFVGPEHAGLPRAQVTMELLCEMNPDVKGEYVREDPDSKMNKGHCVVESKPEGNKPDLRISQPWPELLEYCRSIDLEKQDDMLHGHTPWIVILVRKVEEWKEKHGGAMPDGKQRAEFKRSVKEGARQYEKELNYQEAVSDSYVAFQDARVPGQVQDLIGSPEVPDMTSDTDSFITLQGLYKTKAAKDAAAITALVDNALAKVGRPSGSVPKEEVETFCKNARKLLVVTTRSIEEEYGQDTCAKDEICCELGDPYEVPEQTPVLWYLAMRAADMFKTKNGRYPGEEDEQVGADEAALWTILKELTNGMGIESDHLSEKHAQEITRYGASEIHNIASVVGGIASQEAVKAITRQYTPLENTVIFNGLTGVMGRYDL
eukprot:jgi/Undpi1/6617/HiC_scaffold_20.g09096.m1